MYLTHIADYEYDPWGKVLSIKDASGQDLSSNPNSSAVTNPLRYRGYYYDAETGFYYLQSRYYDPAISRFINADNYVSTGQGYLGHNMFAYCNNNPVKYSDSSGKRRVSSIEVEDIGRKSEPPEESTITEDERIVLYSEHKKNARESTRKKHEEGETRRKRDAGGEKGDAKRKDRSNKRKNAQAEMPEYSAPSIPAPETPSFWERVKYGALGFGSLIIVGALYADNITPWGATDDVYVDQFSTYMIDSFGKMIQ